MGQALLPIAIAGTALSAYGERRAGQSAYKASKFEAAQLQQQAQEDLAVSQRKALEIDRQGRLRASKALAIAAASGAGATDPTVMNLMATYAGETEYEKMVALYEGESAAGYKSLLAESTRQTGRERKQAGRIAGLSTALSGGTSLYAKYNPDLQ